MARIKTLGKAVVELGCTKADRLLRYAGHAGGTNQISDSGGSNQIAGPDTAQKQDIGGLVLKEVRDLAGEKIKAVDTDSEKAQSEKESPRYAVVKR